MGGGVSINIQEIRKDWLDVFRAMKLRNDEIKKMYSIYNSVDVDKSGSIDVVELLTLLDIERTPFNERIFSAFDKDRTGHIDLYEFVVSLWKFCTLGNGAINIFAFDIYDKDADGQLTNDQVKKMFRELFGVKGMEHDTAKAGLAELLKMGVDGLISIEVFRPYCKTHQVLLNPVFAMQRKLRAATLGESTWESLSKRNIEVHVGRNMPIKDLMILHSDRKLFHSLLEDQTLLRVSSMMRIVLDNTDNAAHYVSPAPEEVKRQRNTYIISPESTVRGCGSPKTGKKKALGASNTYHDGNSVQGKYAESSVHNTYSTGGRPPTPKSYASRESAGDVHTAVPRSEHLKPVSPNSVSMRKQSTSSVPVSPSSTSVRKQSTSAVPVMHPILAQVTTSVRATSPPHQHGERSGARSPSTPSSPPPKEVAHH